MIAEERRNEIVWLLQHRNDHLVSPRGASAESNRPLGAGFIHRTLAPAVCPECEGLDSVGCPGCGGRGEVEVWRDRDPYAKNDVVGVDIQRHEARRHLERQESILEEQLRPPRSEAELLADANRRGYAWEEARRAMYRRHDFAAIDAALDALRLHDQEAAHAINAVYVDGWMVEVGLVTPLAEQLCERGLSFLSLCLPDELRTGLAPAHPAETRQSRRRAA